MFGSKRVQKEGCNYVHDDEIWKAHIRHEILTNNRWPELWGFMIKPSSVESSQLKLPPIMARPKHHYPLTTTRLIGWRAEKNLECYGRHAQGRTRIEDTLKQPLLSLIQRL
jgi:hypothetical protein